MAFSFVVVIGGRQWVGMRDLGKSLDGDVRGRRFLLEGILLAPLLLLSLDLFVKIFPCGLVLVPLASIPS